MGLLHAAGFVLERCWENNPAYREENCVFARRDVLMEVRSDCFARLHLFAAQQVFSNPAFSSYSWIGPARVRRKNFEKVPPTSQRVESRGVRDAPAVNVCSVIAFVAVVFFSANSYYILCSKRANFCCAILLTSLGDSAPC